MADGNVMNRVKSIIESDKDRKYIVVSAPGKRYSGDIKITDVLYECHKESGTERRMRCGVPAYPQQVYEHSQRDGHRFRYSARAR